MVKGKERLITIAVLFVFLMTMVVSSYESDIKDYSFSDSSPESLDNFSLGGTPGIVVEGASSSSSERKECFSHSFYSEGTSAVCEICGDKIALDSGTRDYVEVYCEQGDLYIAPRRYDPCDENGCTGTLVSETSEQNPHKHYFNSQEDEFLALCYDRDYIDKDEWVWAARMIQYRNSIKVSLYPDFLNDLKYIEAEQVNYSEIFPPDLIANVSIGKMALFGDYFEESENHNLDLKVKFIKNRYSAGYLIKSPVSEVFSDCEGNCQVSIIQDDAREINPEDLISCEVEIQNSGLRDVESNRVEMPSFDLSIADIEFGNVIYLAPETDESPDYDEIPILVKEKPFFVKICPNFNSNLDTLNYMDVPIDLYLRFNQEHEIDLDKYVIGQKYKSKQELVQEVKDKIIQGKSVENVKEQLKRLEDIKYGRDCFYKVELKQNEITGENEGLGWQEVKIDPHNKIKESDGDNNLKQSPIFSPKSKNLHLVYFPVILEDPDTGEMFPSGEETQRKAIKNAMTSSKLAYEFMRRSWPIADERLKLYTPRKKQFRSPFEELVAEPEEKVVPLKIPVKNLNQLDVTPSFEDWKSLNPDSSVFEWPGKNGGYDADAYERAIRKSENVRWKIIRILAQYGKDFGEGRSKDTKIMAIGMVPEQVLYREGDVAHGMIYSSGGHPIGDSMLVDYSADYKTYVHESGHLFGLYLNGEQYDLVETWGDIASDGVCLNPETGQLCSSFWGKRIVNIWTEKSSNEDKRYSLEDVWEREDLIPEDAFDKIRKQINMGDRYFDFMGSAPGHRSNIWPKLYSYREIADKSTYWNPT